MGALDQFKAKAIRFKLIDGRSFRVIGELDDCIRIAIKSQKPELIRELMWNEFEVFMAIVAPAFNTPAAEYPQIRKAAARDLPAALASFADMAKQIEKE